MNNFDRFNLALRRDPLEAAHEETCDPLAVVDVVTARDDEYDIALRLEDGAEIRLSPDYGVFPSWYAASASMSLADALARGAVEAVRVELVTDSGRVTSSGWRLYLVAQAEAAHP